MAKNGACLLNAELLLDLAGPEVAELVRRSVRQLVLDARCLSGSVGSVDRAGDCPSV
jgi:hypothetical protein